MALIVLRGLACALRMEPDMFNFFMLGPERVRWEITAVGPSGPYRLSINLGPAGNVVEYFDDPTAALLREADIEEVLTQNPVETARSAKSRTAHPSGMVAAPQN
jgi:hypothetical protein